MENQADKYLATQIFQTALGYPASIDNSTIRLMEQFIALKAAGET